MKLADYFANNHELSLKPTPATGEPTDWLDFCELELKGSRILVVDAQFVPSEKDGLMIELASAKYILQAKVTNYGGDRRISRLRVFQDGTSPQLGGKIGETWTDTANTGICDFETFSKAWGSDDDASYKVIEPFFESCADFGVAVFDAATGAVMPFVHSGFGDGNFSVFELTDHGRRIGCEIEFIPSGEKYPFGETPCERQSRIGAIETRANKGDVEAQFQLGKMFQTGDRVGKNLETAASWFEKAAQNGSAEAALKLGLFYKNGKGRPQDFGRARELFEFAAAKGSASALNELGIMYRHGQGVAIDYDKAVAYYRQAAEQGFGNAQYNLAVHYTQGWGVPKSYEEAVKLYRLAADQGVLNAVFNLGCILKRGEPGVPKDEKEAFELFGVGAMNDHASCAHNLADCYETGCGTEMDLKKAFTWYSIAAGKDVPMSQKSLGVLYKNGEGGIKKNLALALKYISKASQKGLAEAHYELGLLYETGEGVAADKVEACKLYQRAVDGGFAKAADKLKELSATLSDAERMQLGKTLSKYLPV